MSAGSVTERRERHPTDCSMSTAANRDTSIIHLHCRTCPNGSDVTVRSRRSPLHTAPTLSCRHNLYSVISQKVLKSNQTCLAQGKEAVFSGRGSVIRWVYCSAAARRSSHCARHVTVAALFAHFVESVYAFARACACCKYKFIPIAKSMLRR